MKTRKSRHTLYLTQLRAVNFVLVHASISGVFHEVNILIFEINNEKHGHFQLRELNF